MSPPLASCVRAVLLAALPVLGAGVAQEGSNATAAQEDEPLALELGRVFTGSIDVRAAGSQCFLLTLPDDVVALEIELDSELADLDLYANPGEHAGADGLSRWRAAGDEGQELLAVHRLGDEALLGGRVFVCVVYDWEEPPVVGGQSLERAPFRLQARAFGARVDAELVPGQPHRDRLDPATGGFRTYAVDVPQGAEALRIDLFEVAGDLDLFAHRGTNLLVSGPGTAEALNPWGAETLLFTSESDPPLRPGRWCVQVENLVDPTERAAFAIVASLAAEAPAVACGLPRLGPPEGASALTRALCGVFELFCGPFAGSGTCITRDGWILTNAHVVATGPGSQVVVCAPLERGLPARESFRGVVEEFDAERDLALVRVTSGFRGEPLPEGFLFPAVPLGDPHRLEMGQALWLAGYPTGGGQKSRVTISLSRGIVSGFERGEHGLLVKTDAEIQGGSSGGAALDAEGLLVGVPTSLVESGAGQFGFVQPLDALPPAWRERLRLAR